MMRRAHYIGELAHALYADPDTTDLSFSGRGRGRALATRLSGVVAIDPASAMVPTAVNA